MAEGQEKKVKLIIDEREVIVPKGMNVLDAAKTAGIMIPYFCYHEALGPAGACRLCAVKFIDGPVKGLRMSCMVEAADGMVVSTTDPEATKMRKLVIEWLMTNHPHDCPVCDEGGECLLQDMTVSGGHSIRQFRGEKRTYWNQRLGPFMEQEMNRCIQCYRCSRFYQEYAGGEDFGTFGIANHVYFGRFRDGPCESPFAGNIVDICPTGTFTDKTARYQARWWDYEMAPSICPVCSLGCNITPIARYRELLKIQARFNGKVNGHFICDLGRFSQGIVNGSQRIHSSSSDGNEVSIDHAIDRLIRHLSEIIRSGHGESVGLLGSGRATLETQLLMRRLADVLKTPWVVYFAHPLEEERTRSAVSCMSERVAVSMREVESVGFIVIVGCDLLKEAPMMALAARQAYRRGARIMVIHSFKPALPFQFEYVESPEERWKAELYALLQGKIGRTGGDRGSDGTTSGYSVMITGAESCSSDTIRAVADMADKMNRSSAGTKISFILREPNSFGAALLSGAETWNSFEAAIRSGKIRTLIGIESDLPDDSHFLDIRKNLTFLAIADHQQHSAVLRPDLIIPTTTYAEMDGTYINQEGRAQKFLRVMNPGLRIRHLDPALHPPREFRLRAPGSEIIAAEALLEHLLASLGGERKLEESVRGASTADVTEWEQVKRIDPYGQGMRILK